MTTSTPPDYYFPDIEFNPDFFEDTTETITKKDADARYLIKTEQDTATAIETFTGGIKTNSIESVLTTDVSNILINSTGNINIGTSASRTTTNPIVIGNATNSIVRFGTSGLQMSTLGTPTATLQAIATAGISIQTPAAAFNFLSNQTGILNIGTASNRSGDINIANTLTTGTCNIVLGSGSLTTGQQLITINRPLSIAYTVPPSQLNQIGGSTFITASQVTYGSTGGTLNLATINSIPIGVYQVFYNIATTITVSPANLTERITNISNTTADITTANTLNFMIDSDLLHQNRIVGHDVTLSGGGLLINTTANRSIYLNQRYVYIAGPTVKATGHLRIVRIG
jgi:hypothetical protein